MSETPSRFPSMRFSALEMAGSLGDMGTLLPLALGMIVVNGLSAPGLFLAVGIFYIGAGLYYRLPTPVQPMKTIGAYAIATAAAPGQVTAAGLLMAASLLFIGGSGLINAIGRWTPRAAVRGVQLTTGILLLTQGVKFIIGTSSLQTMAGLTEPHLTVQRLGPVPIGVVIGVVFAAATLWLLDSKKFPAGLVVVLGGMALGLLLGDGLGLADASPGFYLPSLTPLGLPSAADFAVALPVLVLPQLPMTLGNAVVANADLSSEYFGKAADRVTPKALCITMAMANVLSFSLGGMPMCHGAGGLAAHYRFGARTAGSNLFIGAVFIVLALVLGPHAVAVANLLPLSVLGVLLLYAGATLAMTIGDLVQRKDLYVALVMLGISLASNLAWGFGVGIVLAWALRSERLSV